VRVSFHSTSYFLRGLDNSGDLGDVGVGESRFESSFCVGALSITSWRKPPENAPIEIRPKSEVSSEYHAIAYRTLPHSWLLRWQFRVRTVDGGGFRGFADSCASIGIGILLPYPSWKSKHW
jgi:hypothetical protein